MKNCFKDWSQSNSLAARVREIKNPNGCVNLSSKLSRQCRRPYPTLAVKEVTFKFGLKCQTIHPSVRPSVRSLCLVLADALHTSKHFSVMFGRFSWFEPVKSREDTVGDPERVHRFA